MFPLNSRQIELIYKSKIFVVCPRSKLIIEYLLSEFIFILKDERKIRLVLINYPLSPT